MTCYLMTNPTLRRNFDLQIATVNVYNHFCCIVQKTFVFIILSHKYRLNCIHIYNVEQFKHYIVYTLQVFMRDAVKNGKMRTPEPCAPFERIPICATLC